MNLCDELTIRMLLERHGFNFSSSTPRSPLTVRQRLRQTRPAACWRSAQASAL